MFHILGTGKTLMSLMIRDAMFERRNKTSYFHFISASTSFPHLDSRKHLSDYKTDLRTKIKEAVYGCQHAVIVIDDVHLLQTELLDSMAPFLDSHENVDGVSYRRAIFIFISNTGMFGLIDLADEYYRKVSYWYPKATTKNYQPFHSESTFTLDQSL